MSEEELNRHFKSAVLNSHAYHVPDASGLIKLDAMENPYHLPEECIAAWQAELSKADVNRYPDASMHAMREAVTDAFSIPSEYGLMFGNGSDELIQILLIAVKKASKILSPEPTFVMYKHLGEMLDHEFIGVPLQEDFTLDLPLMLDTIKTTQPEIVFLAWPNNPTGVAYAQSDIEQIIEASNGLVIVDEAYHAFAKHTMLNKIADYPNLLVMRTLSKLGLAGLRLGFLVGSQTIIAELEKVRMPYNIGSLNQLSVSFICNHIDLLLKQTEQIKQDRENLLEELSNIEGIHAWPSDTNFILFKVTSQSADWVHQQLIGKKILIKNLTKAHSALANCLRVTVGTPEENDKFIQALKQILAA